jgi:hypothetical protein
MTIMTRIAKAACATLLGASLALGALAHAAPEKSKKNWTPPAGRIYAQKLADEIMAHHPELISVTFHGVPPGMHDAYTMFAGSYPDRIGNADDPDDIDISQKGITIVDPRWHRPNDTVSKFVMMLPLRDAAGSNLGELVLAYKNPPHGAKADSRYERHFFLAAVSLRDSLEKKIPSYAALFAPAK